MLLLLLLVVWLIVYLVAWLMVGWLIGCLTLPLGKEGLRKYKGNSLSKFGQRWRKGFQFRGDREKSPMWDGGLILSAQ